MSGGHPNASGDGGSGLQRVAFVQWVKPGMQQRYRDAHAHLWPEVVDASRAAGMANYTGFIGGPDGRMVVGYFETPDLAAVEREMATNAVNVRWARTIVPMMETGGDISNGSMEFLEPIWRID
jgi:L-rhamnose mutarotase